MISRVGRSLIFLGLLAPSLLVAQASGDWQIHRSTWQEDIVRGTPIEIHNHYGDVRIRGKKDITVDITAHTQKHKNDKHLIAITHKREQNKLVIQVAYAGNDQDTFKKSGKRRLDMAVFIPEGSPLTVRTHKGLIQARGIVGDVDYFSERGNIYSKNKGHVVIGSRQGDITAALLDTTWKKPAKIESQLGDIEVHLPLGPSLSVNARTAGQITTDYSLTIDHKPKSIEKLAKVKIGKGEHVLSLINKKGAVKILKMAWLK